MRLSCLILLLTAFRDPVAVAQPAATPTAPPQAAPAPSKNGSAQPAAQQQRQSAPAAREPAKPEPKPALPEARGADKPLAKPADKATDKPASKEPPKPVLPSATLAELRTLEGQLQSVLKKIRPCVVAIRYNDGQGSGVIVTAEGHIATAGHLIKKPGDPVTVILPDGKNVKGVTLGCDRLVDSGLMKITEGGPWPHVDLGQSAALRQGNWCVVMGHPFGYLEGRPAVVRFGRVLSSLATTLRTDGTIVAGDSGGPVFDLQGKLVGINSRIGSSASMNYHVPVDVYRQAWDDLAAGRALNDNLPSKDGPDIKAPFRAILADAARCTVRVKCDGRDAALGTIVGPQGWILSKASELRGKISCHLHDGRVMDAKIVGQSKNFDLAMLKVDAQNLPKIGWTDQPTAKDAVGRWVAVAGPSDDPLAVGVISVPARRIPPPVGMLGVVLQDTDAGPKIVNVRPSSPAEKAGLKADDVITQLNGGRLTTHAALTSKLREHRAGETVKLLVTRGDKPQEFSVTLAVIETPGSKRRDLQNTSGGGVSARHDDFPLVLQHDAVLLPVDCGGPLVDLTGKVVGVNIARGGRTETYAVPCDQLFGLMYELMSGRMPPESTSQTPPAAAPTATAKPSATKPPEKPAGAK